MTTKLAKNLATKMPIQYWHLQGHLAIHTNLCVCKQLLIVAYTKDVLNPRKERSH
ncbi:hypothetical protein [Nostoc sp. CHAB 5715]|uniref:hypothetical protein n=1 Tax=Nostoc sp. CHAB 5715 TaxID=2780400 RepID=UPI001E370891|nr:hypothetical protein [Nostoc sp. CHAB 5715]MCC5621015.1 hypothetical protein [Nostoc sp. CHAB 5715]